MDILNKIFCNSISENLREHEKSSCHIALKMYLFINVITGT